MESSWGLGNLGNVSWWMGFGRQGHAHNHGHWACVEACVAWGPSLTFVKGAMLADFGMSTTTAWPKASSPSYVGPGFEPMAWTRQMPRGG